MMENIKSGIQQRPCMVNPVRPSCSKEATTRYRRNIMKKLQYTFKTDTLFKMLLESGTFERTSCRTSRDFVGKH